MDDVGDQRSRLAYLLDKVAVEEGMNQTAIDGVEVFRASTSIPRAPIVYLPRILIVGRGRKRAFLGGETYVYDPSNYLVLSVPLPAECETEASPDEPVLLLAIHLEQAMVGEMMLELDEPTRSAAPTPRGIYSTPMNPEMAGAVIRLLECLQKPTDSRILGRQIVREIVYRVLQSEQSGALRALASRDEHFSRIARVLRYIHADYAKPISMEELAKKAGMSVAAFHNYFKVVTSSSPLQYIKRVRLDQAKLLMAHEGYNASTASQAVGYESASQFSREFKRVYGMTPSEDAEQTRAKLRAS
jgi:AraC-like DNA-binding protein